MTGEPTGFLYPFIEGEERGTEALLDDLAASARHKIALHQELGRRTIENQALLTRTAATAMASRFVRGGRLFAFGNGGSATDAESLVALFLDSPGGRSLPAIALTDDQAILTALANDVGFDLVFVRQLIAHARSDDMVVAFSTSGNSSNLLAAFAAARRTGAMTIGFAGYEGGAMAASELIDCCFVVRSDSVHRIQEAQDALAYELWSAVQGALGHSAAP